MFWTVFKFEVAYWFKRPLTLLFAALFFLMAFFATASDAFLGIATGQIHRNAPFVMATVVRVQCGGRRGVLDRLRGRCDGAQSRTTPNAAIARSTLVGDV